MARLRSFRDVPPGGWRFLERTTGVWLFSDNWDDLVRKVNEHRGYKGIPTTTTEADIERQLCMGLTTSECRAEEGEDYRPVKDLTQSLTTDMAVSANRALLEIIKRAATGSSVLNEQDEAKARAAICRSCPFNRPSRLCSCHAVYRAIEVLIPSSRHQPGVSVCMACGCSLQAKVNLPAEVVQASLSPDVNLPPWCWQKSAEPVAAPAAR